MANPYGPDPVLGGAPSQEAIDRDTPTPARRNHDGLYAVLRVAAANAKKRRMDPPAHLGCRQPNGFATPKNSRAMTRMTILES
jgi:hypothetical protein